MAANETTKSFTRDPGGPSGKSKLPGALRGLPKKAYRDCGKA